MTSENIITRVDRLIAGIAHAVADRLPMLKSRT